MRLPVFLPVLENDLASGQNLLYLWGQILPVLERFASFETGVASKLATTFRWNCNVLPLILPICQFCSSYQELSKFSIYREYSENLLAKPAQGCCTCGSSLLVAEVGVPARLLPAGPISRVLRVRDQCMYNRPRREHRS